MATRLDRFAEILPDTVLSGRGVRLNVAAYLLGASEYIEWPNYRVTVVERACELARVAGAGKELSLGATYQHALAFFDTMQLEAASYALEVRNRLDAQSLAFCVTLWRDRPTGIGEISEEDWNGLLAFRTVPSQLRQDAKRARRTSSRQTFAPNHAPCPLCGFEDNVIRIGPLGDNRWEFVCEGGTHHEDPLSFPVTGT